MPVGETDLILEAALASDPSAASPTWTDLTSRLRSASAHIAGRGDPLDRVEGATLAARLDNNDRALNRSVDPRVRPMKRVRLRGPGLGYSPGAGLTLTNAITDSPTRADGLGEITLLDFIGGFESNDSSEYTAIEVASLANQFSTVTTIDDMGVAVLPDYGLRAAKFTVRPGDVVSSGERCEVVWDNSNEVDGQEFFYGFSVLFPRSWVGPTGGDLAPGVGGGGFKIVHQIHDDTSGGPPVLAFRADSNSLKLRLNGGAVDASGIGTNYADYPLLSTLSKGAWNQFVYYVRWRTGSTGIVQIFHRVAGSREPYKLLRTITGIPTMQSAGAGAAAGKNYAKLGLYRAPESYTDFVYHDGFRRGRNFFDVVAPRIGPDGSTGIWRGTTNFNLNGHAGTNTNNITLNGAGVAIARETGVVTPVGTTQFKITTPGTGTGEGAIFRSATGLQAAALIASGATCVGSAMVRRKPNTRAVVNVRTRIVYTDTTFDDSLTASYDLLDDWQRLRGLPLVANAAKTIDSIRTVVTTTGVPYAAEFYVTGVQTEVGSIATPYVPTDGASAARSAGRTQVPIEGLDETQGWIAILLRPGWDSVDVPATNPYVFRWRDDDSNEIRLRYLTASDSWELTRRSGGAGAVLTSAAVFPRGSAILLVASWDSTTLGLSVSGAAFTTNGNTNIPTLAATTIDFGSSIGSNNHLDGDILWAALGNGPRSALSPATWATWGATDPLPDDKTFGAAADVRATWSADNASYRKNADGYVFDGFADRWPRRFPQRGFDAEVALEASDGFKLLTKRGTPKTKPAFEEFVDVADAQLRPALYYPLNDEEGTKVKIVARKHRRRIEWEHGTWISLPPNKKIRVTRAPVEGISGPPGTYHNTPGLGDPGGIVGSSDMSVRFHRSQSEWASVLLEDNDLGSIRAVHVRVKLAVVNVKQTFVCAPAYDGTIFLSGGIPSNVDIIPFRLHFDPAFPGFVFQTDLDGSLHDISGPIFNVVSTTSPSAGTWYSVLGVYDDVGGTLKMYVNGLLEATQSDISPPGDVNAGNLAIGRRQAASHTSPGDYADANLAHVVLSEKVPSAASVLAVHEAAALRGWDQQASGARVNAILDTLGFWGAGLRDVPSTGRTVQPRRQFGQSYLSEIQLVEESEQPGFFFASRDNRPTLRLSDYQSAGETATPVAVFGDEPSAGELPYLDFDSDDSDDDVRNRIVVEREGSEIVTEISDATSIATYEEATLGIGPLITTSDADDLAIANSRLAALKDAVEAPRSIRLDADLDARLWGVILGLEVGDLVRVFRTPPGSSTREFYEGRVQGGEVAIVNTGGRWALTGEFDLSQAAA